MKVAIGFRLQEGPYGGGNSVIRSLAEHLPARGFQVVWNLDDDDIDIIVLVDPRGRSPNISFAAGAILRYLAFRNPNAIVVQQIHDIDERKGTKTMNFRQRLANYAADHTVCVGRWMLDLDVVRNEHRNAYSAIPNGGRTSVFHRNGHRPWDGNGPMRIVTHHWGAHRMKGFDVYLALDTLLDDPTWRQRVEFTYIGNVAAGVSFRNTRVLPPLADEPLAAELRQHHAYITASINEPAGLHHIEGALCGLPLLYRRSGALPEYCEGFGLAFDGVDDFAIAIERMRQEYDTWLGTLDAYSHSDTRMVREYAALFERLDNERRAIVARRHIWRNPLLIAANMIPF